MSEKKAGQVSPILVNQMKEKKKSRHQPMERRTGRSGTQLALIILKPTYSSAQWVSIWPNLGITWGAAKTH